jgi:hypothetical protein
MTKTFCRPSAVTRGADLPEKAPRRFGLTLAERHAVLGLHRAGWQVADLARLYGVSVTKIELTLLNERLPAVMDF